MARSSAFSGGSFVSGPVWPDSPAKALQSRGVGVSGGHVGLFVLLLLLLLLLPPLPLLLLLLLLLLPPPPLLLLLLLLLQCKCQ